MQVEADNRELALQLNYQSQSYLCTASHTVYPSHPQQPGSADLLEAEHPELAVTVLHAGTWGGG